MAAEENLDGLVCVTPLELTSELITGALGLNIPLVIEKPPGHSLEVARQLRDVVVDSGVPHMVSFNRRFSPAFARAASWIADGGDARRPKRLISRMLRHNRREKGFVFGTAIHAIDTLRYLCGGEVESVASDVRRLGVDHRNAHVALVRFSTGAVGTLLTNWWQVNVCFR